MSCKRTQANLRLDLVCIHRRLLSPAYWARADAPLNSSHLARVLTTASGLFRTEDMSKNNKPPVIHQTNFVCERNKRCTSEFGTVSKQTQNRARIGGGRGSIAAGTSLSYKSRVVFQFQGLRETVKGVFDPAIRSGGGRRTPTGVIKHAVL